MRAKSTFVVGLVIAGWCFGSIAPAQEKAPSEKKKSAASGKKPAAEEKGAVKKAAQSDAASGAENPAPLRFVLPQSPGPVVTQIEKVQKDGLVDAGHPGEDVPLPPPGFSIELTEGYYIGIVSEKYGAGLAGAQLLRAQVTDVGEAGAVKLQVARSAAAAIKQGEFLVLFRPAGATTTMMKKLPDLAPIEAGPAPGAKDEGNAKLLTQSSNNGKQIMLALHNFHDAFRHLPPAVVVGPDKKPWHSWRVMLLPFLDAADVYNQYKWDEPWDGPNNKKLLSRMPAIYADPVYGENKEHLTHYVAITGDDAAFSSDPIEFDGEEFNPVHFPGRSFREFTDGLSNTLMIGPVGPDRKIPWMKPEDIVVGDDFPELGKKGSFALPYKTERGDAGLFARGDGSVTTILEGVDMDLFRALVTIHGGEIVDWSEVPSVAIARAGPTVPVLYIMGDAKKPIARLSMEPAPVMPAPLNLLAPPQAVPAPARPAPRIKE